jgi:hypothetical protein
LVKTQSQFVIVNHAHMHALYVRFSNPQSPHVVMAVSVVAPSVPREPNSPGVIKSPFGGRCTVRTTRAQLSRRDQKSFRPQVNFDIKLPVSKRNCDLLRVAVHCTVDLLLLINLHMVLLTIASQLTRFCSGVRQCLFRTLMGGHVIFRQLYFLRIIASRSRSPPWRPAPWPALLTGTSP